MIYNELYDLEGFIRLNTLNDLKTKNFNFKENDIVFIIENFTFYTIKSISEETNTLDEVEVNANFKAIKLETISKFSELEKIEKKLNLKIQDTVTTLENIKQFSTDYSEDNEKPYPNYVNNKKVRFLMSNEVINNDSNYKDFIFMNSSDGVKAPFTTAIGIGKNTDKIKAFIMRSNEGSLSWRDKEELWHTGNFNPENKIDKNTEFNNHIGIKNVKNGIFINDTNQINFTSSNGQVSFNFTQLGPNRISAFAFYDGSENQNSLATIYCGPLSSSSNGTFAGSINASGDIRGARVFNAVYNDYAEFFPKKKETITEPGDIIALDENSNEECYVKATSFHSVIVGVHSDEFGHLIGGKQPKENEDYLEINKNDFIPIGLAGRVKVKFKGIARKGMRVVPSNIDGVGRKYNPKIDSQDHIIGYVVEDNLNEEIKRVKIKIR